MSNTSVYNKTAGDVMREALRASNIVAAEMPIEAVEIQRAHTALNDVLSHWVADGIHLWSETEALLPLNPNQRTYKIGTDHCFTEYAYTTTTVAAAAAATTFTVASTTGMVAGQSVGIELSTGYRWWDEIDTVVDGTSFTTVNGVTADVSSGAGIYAYTDMIDQPVRVLSARHAYGYTYDEISADQISRQEYYDQTAKGTTGNVNQWYFSRQMEGGQLSVWPVASICTQILRFTFVKPQYVPENQIDNVYVPVEWYLALKWAVVVQLGTIHGVGPERMAIFKMEAAETKQRALDNDVEIDSCSIQPYCG